MSEAKIRFSVAEFEKYKKAAHEESVRQMLRAENVDFAAVFVVALLGFAAGLYVGAMFL